MPRYKYECGKCNHLVIAFHRLKDTVTDCIKCDSKDTMKKLLSRPIVLQESESDIEEEIGELTKEHIEANREILKQQKEKAKKENYEPS
jgi:putative FmdB family regulatory protein